MSQLNVKRRIFNTLAVAMMAGAALPTWAQGAQFNDYGWPTSANEKISAKSVAWLKEKGWWPIQVAFQPPWSGQNTINLVMLPDPRRSSTFKRPPKCMALWLVKTSF